MAWLGFLAHLAFEPKAENRGRGRPWLRRWWTGRIRLVGCVLSEVVGSRTKLEPRGTHLEGEGVDGQGIHRSSRATTTQISGGENLVEAWMIGHRSRTLGRGGPVY
jgi:hypothetical protein